MAQAVENGCGISADLHAINLAVDGSRTSDVARVSVGR